MRPKQLHRQALVGDGAFFEPVLIAIEAGGKAAAAVVVEAAYALSRVLAHPLLSFEPLQPHERGLRHVYPALCLLAFPAPVVLDAEGPDTNLFIVGDATLAIRYGGFAR